MVCKARKYHRVIVFLMLRGSLDAYDDVRVEDLGFEGHESIFGVQH